MPTYEYECGLCHCHFERKQRFDEEPVTICPKCEGKAHRVFHSAPVIFKGSGFYITDSRQGSDIDKAKEKKSGESKRKEQVEGEGTTTASH